MMIALTFIPKQFWDYQLRELSAKVQYSLVVLGLEYNEQQLIKGSAICLTKLPLKKWFHTTKILMVPKPVDPKDDKKKGKKKPVKGKKGKVV